jgi:DNA mismatch endonuclease, patch repair protein
MHRTVIFVHGCYWHRHAGCKQAYTPRSNMAFWSEKFRTNIERDKQAVERLMSDAWRVIIIWECGLKSSNAERELAWLPLEIRSGSQAFLEWPLRQFQ